MGANIMILVIGSKGGARGHTNLGKMCTLTIFIYNDLSNRE